MGNINLQWENDHTATVPEYPNVKLEFAEPEAEDDEIIDTVLGMLLQSFSK